MIKGAVFDLDGVLIDTEYYQWQSWVEVLKPFGITLSKEAYHIYAGKRGDAIEAELIKNYNLNIQKNRLLECKERLLMEWFRSDRAMKLMPYAREAVEYFIDKKVAVALASGGPRDEILIKLEKARLGQYFSVIVSGSDVKRGKPYPDIYLSTAQRLALEPRSCVAFEDTQYGVEAAKSAGLIAIAIPNEFSKKQNFSKADVEVSDLKEALRYVAGLIE